MEIRHKARDYWHSHRPQFMFRLSELLKTVTCDICKQATLHIARVNLGANNVVASVMCSCGVADMLRWNYGELGKVPPERLNE